VEIVADKQLTRALLELVPLDDSGGCWLLGLEMEKPGNLSGIEYAPADGPDRRNVRRAVSARICSGTKEG
jgi:hypothetical protein